MEVLLHTCCGPCMTAFDKYFAENDINYTVFFYNPNIHPYKEYLKRYKTLREYTDNLDVRVINKLSFQQNKWTVEFKDVFAPERCRECYKIRLGSAAEAAAENGFKYFTTTLLISPYQEHEMIREIGESAAKKHGISFYYRDFRDLFREGQAIAREEDMYRQKYCGCIYSFEESKFKDKIVWD